jgi:hypothetical protein
MAHVDFQDVSVSFSYPLGQIDKPTAAKLIADISKFRLNESVVVDLTVDEQGHGVAVIRCPSRQWQTTLSTPSTNLNLNRMRRPR